MWKLTLLATCALALKVQNLQKDKTPYGPIPQNLEDALSDMDTATTAGRNILESMLNNANDPLGLTPAMGVLNSQGNKLRNEFTDQDLMKDTVKAIPWVINKEQTETNAVLMDASDAVVKAVNQAGIPMFGVSVDTKDLDLYNYMKKGLVIEPKPGWEIIFPSSFVSSLKTSLARYAHEMEETAAATPAGMVGMCCPATCAGWSNAADCSCHTDGSQDCTAGTAGCVCWAVQNNVNACVACASR